MRNHLLNVEKRVRPLSDLSYLITAQGHDNKIPLAVSCIPPQRSYGLHSLIPTSSACITRIAYQLTVVVQS